MKKENKKEGIIKMGMVSPIDVRERDDGKFEIVDGYHRWRACRELGYSKILINNLGKISDEVAKKLVILKEKAKVPLDLVKTSMLLNELAKNTSLEELALETGYDLPELKADLELINFDWEEYEKSLTGDKSDLKTIEIVITKEQYEIFMKAVDKIREEEKDIKLGRALELICADFLAGKG